MFNTLKKTLEGVWSEEKIELVHRAEQVFLSYEYETPGVAINYLMQQSSTMPNEDLLFRIMTVIEENVDILILNHTIKLTQASLQEKLFILEALALVYEHDDQERINFLASDNVTIDDDRERFLEILAFVSGIELHNFEHCVWSVHPSLIETIAHQSNAKLHDHDYDTLEPPTMERIELFKTYIAKYGRSATMLAIAMGYRLNINYEFLLDRFQKDISALEPSDPKQAAIEIIGLLIMSNVALEDIRKKANITVSQLYNTPVFRTSTLSLISSVLSEVGING